MKYPSEKQMLASIFEAIMNKEQLDFSRGEMFGRETRLDIH